MGIRSAQSFVPARMMRFVKPANLALVMAAVAVTVVAALAFLSINDDEAEASSTTTVLVKNNSFQSSSIQIDPGDTVQWLDGQAGGTHTVTQCSGSGTGCPGGAPGFNSGAKSDPASAYLTQAFPNEGTFFYRCQIHGNAMRGTITVGNPATPTASPPPTPTPAPTLSGRSDVNCDAETNGDDVLALLLYSAGATPAAAPLGAVCAPIGTDEGDSLKGDLNCDGLVNARDALVALYGWAGLTVPGLPEGCLGP